MAELKRQIDGVNRERKLQQTAVGGELAGLEAEWQTLVAKNGEIEAACRRMEEEIVLMQASSQPAAPQCVLCLLTAWSVSHSARELVLRGCTSRLATINTCWLAHPLATRSTFVMHTGAGLLERRQRQTASRLLARRQGQRVTQTQRWKQQQSPPKRPRQHMRRLQTAPQQQQTVTRLPREKKVQRRRSEAPALAARHSPSEVVRVVCLLTQEPAAEVGGKIT